MFVSHGQHIQATYEIFLRYFLSFVQIQTLQAYCIETDLEVTWPLERMVEKWLL